MKQVTKSLLSLALLGALAGGVAVFAWLRTATTTGQAGANDDSLVRLDTARIARFEIEDGGHSFRVERNKSGGWDVATPVRIAADPTQIEQVLSALARLRVTKRFGDDDPPPAESAMGLDAPRAVFSAWTDDEPPRGLRIELGARSEFNRQEYVRYTPPDGEPVVRMLATGARQSLIRSASQLYDRRVIGARTDEIVRVRVEPREPTPERVAFTLERDEGGAFRCTDPFEGEADALVVRRVMEGLAGAPVSEHLTLDAGGDLEPFGLHEPSFTVTVWLRPQGSAPDAPLVERKVFIGPLPEDVTDERKATVRVARSDQSWVGVASAFLWYALPHEVEAIKTKRVTAVERALVDRIEMELESGEHVILERGEGQQAAWRLLAPEPGRAKPQIVNAFLLAVSNLTGTARALEGKAVTDTKQLASLGVDEHARRVRLLDKGGDPLAVIRLGKVDGEDLFVLREGADFVARVPKKRLQELPHKAIELRD